MDFTKFINSKDIRDYHRKIGYEYNSLEAAWLVSRCHSITLRERHEAWQWIIDNMPDLIVKDGIITKEENGWAKGEKISLNGKTLHEYIAAYMEMQDKFIREMKKGGKDIAYNFEYLYKKDYSYLDKNERFDNDTDKEYYDAIFPRWESCIDFIKSKALDYDIISARVRAITIGESEVFTTNSFVEVAPDGEIMDAEVHLKEDPEGFIDLACFFFEQWFEFPVPFSKGDIVCINSGSWYPKGPIVLEGINVTDWEHGDKRIEINKNKGWDSSDMTLWGYYVVNPERYAGVDCDTFWNYMDLEYCNDLTGANKCLKPISAFIKGEIDINLLLDAYYHLVIEEFCDMRDFRWYTPGWQEAAGVLEKKEQRENK